MILSREEKETQVNFNEAEPTAHIYTCSRAWITHLKKLGLVPESEDTSQPYAEFALPKAWVRKPSRPKNLSAARRQQLSEMAGKMRENKDGGAKGGQ